jgi:hypothetical protein
MAKSQRPVVMDKLSSSVEWLAEFEQCIPYFWGLIFFGVCSYIQHIELHIFSNVDVHLRAPHPRDWEPMTITPQALSMVGKAEPVQVRFTLRLRGQQSRWMQDGCKVHTESCMTSNGSCFMVTWTFFKNIHLSKVGPTQNRETMELRMFTTADLFYFIMCEDHYE